MIMFEFYWEEDCNFLFVQTNHLVRCRSGEIKIGRKCLPGTSSQDHPTGVMTVR